MELGAGLRMHLNVILLGIYSVLNGTWVVDLRDQERKDFIDLRQSDFGIFEYTCSFRGAT